MFLLDLPHISAFLSTWLATEDIYKLDKALLDSSFLPYWQNILSDPYFITYGCEETKKKYGIEKLEVIDDYLFEWLIRRKVHIRTLRINEPDMNLTLLECSNVVSKLDYLHIFYRYRTLPIILSCKDHLKELELVGYESQFTDVLPYISQFKQLHTLKIASFHKTIKSNRSEINEFINNSNHTNSNNTTNNVTNNNITNNTSSITTTTSEKLLNLKKFHCCWESILNEHLTYLYSIAPNIKSIEIINLDRKIYHRGIYNTSTNKENRIKMFQNMVKCYPNLYSFKIRSCQSFLKSVPELAKLTHLHILEMHFDVILIEMYNNNLSETMLNTIFYTLPSLEILSLRNCKLVTNQTILIITSSCLNIRKLDLASCDKITDIGIIAIADKYPFLEDIKLSFLHLITDISMLRLANYCNKLKSIDITACKNISKISTSVFKFQEVKVIRK